MIKTYTGDFVSAEMYCLDCSHYFDGEFRPVRSVNTDILMGFKNKTECDLCKSFDNVEIYQIKNY